MLEPAPRRKTSDYLVQQIQAFIADQDLRPGDPLPTEHALAERFGVSRISVREATKTLGFLGVVDAKPGRGLSVGCVDVGRLTQTLSFHPAMHDVSDAELIDSRVVLETGVLPYVVRRVPDVPDILDGLDRINQQWKEARKLAEFMQLDIAFHQHLLESSGLRPLAAFNELLQIFFERFRRLVSKREWQNAIRDHQRITAALRDRNAPAAAEILRRHIESHRC